jgi:hypothetical protein
MTSFSEFHPTARFVYNGEGILIVTIKDDLELTEQDIKDHREIARRMVGEQPHCVLAIAGERTQATEEARIYAAAHVPAGRIAEAIIVRSLPVCILGNFYLKFHKPGLLTRMFDDHEEALAWLRAQLQLHRNKPQ